MGDPAEQMVVTMTRSELDSTIERAAAKAVKEVISGKPPLWVRLEKVAELYDTTPAIIARLIKKGAPARRVGKDYRVNLDQFGRWLDEHPDMRK